MSLYSQYIKEREDYLTVENDRGFATFTFNPDGSCYIRDVYVHPDFRMSGECFKLADEITIIAKEKGASKLYGTITPMFKGASESMKMMLSYGFKIDTAREGVIILSKDI